MSSALMTSAYFWFTSNRLIACEASVRSKVQSSTTATLSHSAVASRTVWRTQPLVLLPQAMTVSMPASMTHRRKGRAEERARSAFLEDDVAFFRLKLLGKFARRSLSRGFVEWGCVGAADAHVVRHGKEPRHRWPADEGEDDGEAVASCGGDEFCCFRGRVPGFLSVARRKVAHCFQAGQGAGPQKRALVVDDE